MLFPQPGSLSPAKRSGFATSELQNGSYVNVFYVIYDYCLDLNDFSMYLAEWVNVLLMAFQAAAQKTFLVRFCLWHALMSVGVPLFSKAF